jgi:hypothetical protein
MDFVALGRACLSALVTELTGVVQPAVALEPPRLVVRESTVPPPRR